MTVEPISNGIVIDHITAGKGMELYKVLHLDELSCSVAIIKNAVSSKMGKKDIIKIDGDINLDFDILGLMDSGVTVNVIKDGVNRKHTNIQPPEKVTNVLKCKNPRCITTTEQELPHIFKLTDKQNLVYRCIYCESKAK